MLIPPLSLSWFQRELKNEILLLACSRSVTLKQFSSCLALNYHCSNVSENQSVQAEQHSTLASSQSLLLETTDKIKPLSPKKHKSLTACLNTGCCFSFYKENRLFCKSFKILSKNAQLQNFLWKYIYLSAKRC